MSETVTFVNETDDTYKLVVIPSESTKYELSVDESKFIVKKGETCKVTITICFNKFVSMGLTGQVEFQLTKKKLMGGDTETRALRFQFEGIVPCYHSKDLVKTSDEEQFRIGDVNGVLSTVKGESCVAFHYDVSDQFQKQDYDSFVNIYRDIHHRSILCMCGIVLETSTILLDGDTVNDLQTLIQTEKLSVPFLLQCCLDCANALGYLSHNKIMHRNVKPSKLRVVHHDITNEGSSLVKLTDMTTICRLKEGEKIKRSPGTYQYMAPEVMEIKEHDLKIDVFSFGMTMYHTFTGKMPYGEMSNSDVINFVTSGKRLPLDAKDFPNGIAELIEKCWDQNPDARPKFSEIVPTLDNIVKQYSQ